MNPEQARSDLALAQRSYTKAAFTSLPAWTLLAGGAIVGGVAGFWAVAPASDWTRLAWFGGSLAVALALVGIGAWLRSRRGLRGAWRPLRAVLAELALAGLAAWVLGLDPASPSHWAVFLLCLAAACGVRLALLRDARGDWRATLRACGDWREWTRRRS